LLSILQFTNQLTFEDVFEDTKGVNQNTQIKVERQHKVRFVDKIVNDFIVCTSAADYLKDKIINYWGFF
jgi:putative NIF3 family GTP cyclohydrolase 1 type 2